MKRITEMRWPLVAALASAIVAFAPSGAAAAETEEERGAALPRQVESGESTCADLSVDDFAAVGELAMGRMLSSADAHEAMDRTMASMMGRGGLDRMHEVMGVRFSGCGSPRFPGSYGGMMGAMGMMGGGGMMWDGDGAGGSDDDVGAWIAIAMLVLLVVAVIAVAILAPRRWRPRGSGPLEILAQRFARGEISAEEYAERRRLLEQGAR